MKVNYSDEKMSIDLPKNSISYHYSLHPNDTIIGYMIVKDSMEGGMSPDTFRCVDHLTDFFDLHFMQPCVVVCNISNILETCSSPMQSASSSSNFMSAFSSIVNDFSLLSPSTTDKSSKENNSSKNVTGPIIPKFIFKPIEIIGSLDSKQSIVMTNLNLLKFCIDHTMSLDSPMNLVVLKDQCKFYCNALRNLLSDAKTEKSDLDAEKLKYISESIEKIYKSIDENLELTNIKSEGCSLSEYMATLIQKVSILDSNP
ncbi:MAG: hypothetical protein MHMPM18_000668 [Marteilia pararefringens]